jgi:hypothetical protein
MPSERPPPAVVEVVHRDSSGGQVSRLLPFWRLGSLRHESPDDVMLVGQGFSRLAAERRVQPQVPEGPPGATKLAHRPEATEEM